MPARIPQLTLFTSPTCTLCTVAKADLHSLQRQIPFDLSIYDIRSSAPSYDPYEQTVWRRLYQYDVPVLHRWLAPERGAKEVEVEGSDFEGLRRGGRVAKHRIDKEKLLRQLREWTKELNSEEETEDDEDPAIDVCDTKRRRTVESDLFEISTERNPVVDDSHHTDFGHGYSYDYITTTSTIPILGVPSSPPPTESPTRKCFNCNSPEHISSSCPHPRSSTAIFKNRAAFNDANPSMAGESTKLGSVSERERRLAFVERFEPGVVSEELRWAIGWANAESVEWPWLGLGRIAIWGYPPGWIINEGARHPTELVRDRIGRDLDFENVELLHIFDDHPTDPPSLSTLASLSSIPSPPLNAPVSSSSIAPPPLPPIIARPLPPNAPPPLPPGPPPPIPPPPTPSIRLVHYRTRQFVWETLPVYRVRYPFPLLRHPSRGQAEGGSGETAAGRTLERDLDSDLDLAPVGERKEQVDVGLSEGEMDISDDD